MQTKTIKTALCVVAGLLAAMGLIFASKCPMLGLYGEEFQSFFFSKQLIWNIIGIALCFGAAKIRWNHWLKLAPWAMILSVLLIILAHFCAPVHGSHRWLRFGPVSLNVNLVFVLAWALLAAWFASKKKSWIVYLLLFATFAYCTFIIVGNANRLARVYALLASYKDSPFMYAQNQMCSAYAVSNWFGDAGRSLSFLPLANSVAMPSASALLFGKWFPIVTASLFAILGALLTYIKCATQNSSKRTFIFFWGAAVLIMAFGSFYHSVGIAPVFGISPALAGYGGSLALFFWTGLGIVLSILSDEDEWKEVSKVKLQIIAGVWGVALLVYGVSVALSSASDKTFHAPRLSSDVFGEFGINAKRGEIFAADGSVLAKTVKAWRLCGDPVILSRNNAAFSHEVISNICSRLDIDPLTFLDKYYGKKGRYVRLHSDISKELIDWFKTREARVKARGFFVESYQKRVYPLGADAAHITGCIYRNTTRETSGCTGIESVKDSVLAGRNGTILRNASREEEIAAGKPVHGGNVTTTIIPSFQTALAKALEKAAATNKAETAWGIIMNTRTGEIAAMTSLPTYDPAASRDLKPGPNYFINTAAMSIFEPAGLMYPLTFAMAIDNGTLKPDAKIDVGNGEWEYNGAKWTENLNGEMSVANALAKRSGIAAGKTGVMLGRAALHEYLTKFGFGGKVGNNTVYGEETGIVRSTNHIDNVMISRIGLGSGVAVTGLQIANAYAALANGGKSVPAHLITKLTDTNRVETSFGPYTNCSQIVSKETAASIVKMMSDAINAAAGEYSVDFGGIKVAGAIGKARTPEKGQYSKTKFNYLAAGFFPADNPEWTVVIGLNNPSAGNPVDGMALPVLAETIQAVSSK